jgi:hypothetical protein
LERRKGATQNSEPGTYELSHMVFPKLRIRLMLAYLFLKLRDFCVALVEPDFEM